MGVYLEHFRERPAFSRAYFLELPSAGERSIAQRERAYEQFRAMFEALARAGADRAARAAAAVSRSSRARSSW